MSKSNTSYVPIALDRTPRRCTSGTPSLSGTTVRRPAENTPNRKTNKAKKRVRFSDPGPSHSRETDQADELSTTGLTPLVGRTSIATNGPRRRRHSTPARGSGSGSGSGAAPLSGEIYILPLCQVLDGRVKRRIRRNGLSEEMNTIYAEKRRRAREAKEDVDKLKAALAEKDAEIARLHGEPAVLHGDRVLELEREVDALKSQLAEKGREPTIPGSPSYDWTMAARGPFADGYTDLDDREMHDVANDSDDDVFGDTTMADLACSTPSRRTRASASFLTPPPTSPAAATPSSSVAGTYLARPRLHAAVQASLPDPEKAELFSELASLQLEIIKLTATLEDYSGLTQRLSDRLGSFPTGDDDDSAQHTLEGRLHTVLQTLSDRTAALQSLAETIGSLGFPGVDATDMVASLRSSFRTARLELEYLTPGEIELPLTSAGAAVLDLMLTRLRELGRRAREADADMDEYHALEQSLRAQLGARADAMDAMAASMREKDAAVAVRDDRILELDVGADRLKGAMRTYARDVRELEALVQKLDAQLTEAVKGRELTESELQGRAAELSSALDRASRLAGASKEHGRALALRDARLAELRKEVDRVNGALRDAYDQLQRLRVEKATLETKAAADRMEAKGVVDAMKAELERVVKMSEGFLATLKGEEKPGAQEPDQSIARPGSLANLSAKLAAPAKRRRYDSGLGFLDNDDVEGVCT